MLSKNDLKGLIHELSTHQIELELQNEDLRKSHMDLDVARLRYADLYDFAPVGYLTLDDKNIIVEANVRGASMLGLNKRELIGKYFSGFIEGSGDKHIFISHMNNAINKKTRESFEIRLRARNGHSFYAGIEGILYEEGDNNEPVVRMAIFDISERKEMEKGLRISRNEMERRSRELEAINKELEQFSYTVAHDLKAPLRSIKGFAEAISEDYFDKFDEKGKDFLHRIVAASDRMTQLIEAMLTLSRQTHRQLMEKKVDLSSLAEVTSHDLRLRYPGRKVELLIQPGLSVNADPDMMAAVVENLLDNAWKFTSKHRQARIEFGAEDAKDGTGKVYFVRDDGAGFNMKYADKLFMPFKRCHTESEFPGLGVGLATVKRIIERHGGRIWAESAEEEGSTFYFTLALQTPASGS